MYKTKIYYKIEIFKYVRYKMHYENYRLPVDTAQSGSRIIALKIVRGHWSNRYTHLKGCKLYFPFYGLQDHTS